MARAASVDCAASGALSTVAFRCATFSAWTVAVGAARNSAVANWFGVDVGVAVGGGLPEVPEVRKSMARPEQQVGKEPAAEHDHAGAVIGWFPEFHPTELQYSGAGLVAPAAVTAITSTRALDGVAHEVGRICQNSTHAFIVCTVSNPPVPACGGAGVMVSSRLIRLDNS